MPTSIYIVLPAFNEAPALRHMIPDLFKTLKSQGIPFTLCLVNDGSTDGTDALVRSFANEPHLMALRHEKNKGYGAAIKTGVLWVVNNAQPVDVLITMDADNTHPLSYIAELIKKLQDGYDVVTASYTRPGGKAHGVPLKRQLLSRAANGLLGMRFPFAGVATYTNGYRGYRVGSLQEACRRYGDHLMNETNFAGGTELFIKVLRTGARAGEVPFVLHYENRGSGSKIHLTQTILGYLKLLKL